VQPGTPKVWPGLPEGAPRHRLGLARWLVSRDNPLTARVLSNRLWSELFGAGLVLTLEDFGSEGEAPSHPGLLDWLAVELMDRGWSMRHLLETIVLSATYGQSSVQAAAARETDPTNRWLARGPSVRLSAETLRDQALAVSGLLVPALGGPSVMPPQPDGVWMQIYSGERWVTATGADRHRRSLYTFWRRTSPHPAMLTFDAQSRESCVLRRQRTNTPLQALVLWNDEQFLEAARVLAQRTLSAPGDDSSRLQEMHRRCTGHLMDSGQLAAATQSLAELRARFLARPEDAASLVRLGQFPADASLPPAELASFLLVANAFLNLDSCLCID
jgi:hypothetical protein